MTLRQVVRHQVQLLDDGGMGSVSSVVAALKEAGAINGNHVGRTDMPNGSDECVEWYAGQILNVLEKGSWFAVNSIINCLDKFCPEAP